MAKIRPSYSILNGCEGREISNEYDFSTQYLMVCLKQVPFKTTNYIFFSPILIIKCITQWFWTSVSLWGFTYLLYLVVCLKPPTTTSLISIFLYHLRVQSKPLSHKMYHLVVLDFCITLGFHIFIVLNPILLGGGALCARTVKLCRVTFWKIHQMSSFSLTLFLSTFRRPQ